MFNYEEAVKSGKALLTAKIKREEIRFGRINRAAVERIIIVSLSVIVALSAAVYFVGIPAANKLSETRAEVSDLQAQQHEYAALISDMDKLEQESLQKTSEMNSAAASFGTPMDAEKLDKYITGLLVANSITANSLQMSPLTPTSISPYSTISGTHTDDSVISVYTVTADANGTLNGLYGLIDTVNEEAGAELVSYSWKNSGTAVDNSAIKKQTLSLVFKVYVV